MTRSATAAPGRDERRGVWGHVEAPMQINPGGETMMELKEIGHILLRVLDLERSKKFYSEVLGFHVLEEDPEQGVTFMAPPGDSHAIDVCQVKDTELAGKQTPGVRGLGHLAFRVEDEEAL